MFIFSFKYKNSYNSIVCFNLLESVFEHLMEKICLFTTILIGNSTHIHLSTMINWVFTDLLSSYKLIQNIAVIELSDASIKCIIVFFSFELYK